MKLSSIFGIRGARDKPQDSYNGSAYSFLMSMTIMGEESQLKLMIQLEQKLHLHN